MPSRRQALGGITSIGALATAGAVRATDLDADYPGHITNAGDDLDELAAYQPYLDAMATDREKLIGVYGWYADSEDHDTRAYYYWTKYTNQNSLFDSIPLVGSLLNEDAHFGDHEPIALFTDPDTGEVQELLYSGYHHYGVVLSENLPLVQDERTYPTHPSLQVAHPHHHYIAQRNTDAGIPAENVRNAEFGSFLDAKPDWADDGVFGPSHLPSVLDPWRAKDRGYWWADGTWDKQLADIRVLLNWRDSGHDELIRE